MPILQWHDSVYALGIEEIDCQHRELVRLINDAHDCARSEGDPTKLLPVVQAMARYAVEHFATEEALMSGAAYDRSEAHFDEHEGFEAKTLEFSDALRKGEVSDPQEVFQFLGHWLSAHILEVDAAFGRFLKAAGGG